MCRLDTCSSGEVTGVSVHRDSSGDRPQGRAGRTIGSLLAAAALAAGACVVPAAAADPVVAEPDLGGVELPVPATDVTDTDTDLGSAAREVVVAVPTSGGPEVVKLRARTQAEAEALVRGLSAEGVTAEPNATYRVGGVAPTAGGKSSRGIDLTRIPGMQASAGLLAAEPLGASQWGMAAVGAERAWAFTRGSGVTVAVVDSGVDASHPDLAGRVLPQVNMLNDRLTGDPYGHGTHVAGIVAASLDGVGVAGIANQARIRPVRVLDATGAGDAATIAAGILSAVRSGATVVNLSLGGVSRSRVIASAVTYATSRGVTVVAAAGNLYQVGNPVVYPAALPKVIGVSAIDPSGRSSAFAETGSYVDLVAPGESIVSTVPGGGYLAGEGTSAAAPFVSAAAALMKAANPRLTPARIEAILTATARDDRARDGRDKVFGAGLLQVDAAVQAAARLPYGVRSPAASVQVKPVRSKRRLFVNVNPNRGSGYWVVQVQRRAANGSWKQVRQVRTQGSRETRTLALPAGTYRVVVAAKHGYRSATSASVTLRR